MLFTRKQILPNIIKKFKGYSCEDDDKCIECEEDRCKECMGGYYKLNKNSPCVSCETVLGCERCEDYVGCVKCTE